MAKSITVNTGEKIEVRNTDGELMGYFYFNPADPDLMRRCNESSEKINKIIECVGENPSSDGILKINAEIKEQMAIILGEDAANTLFLYNSPLAVMPDGSIYAIYVFDIVCRFIEEEVKNRTEKIAGQVNKYTAKYDHK